MSLAPFDLLLDYERRSLAHQPGRPELVEAPGHWRGVGFRVGRHRLVGAFGEVVEILSLPVLTTVPGSQPWMLGLANIRGSLYGVVDLKQFLEGERSVVNEGQRCLLVKQPGGNVILLIDELYGQRSFNDSHLVDRPESFEGRYAHVVARAYRLGDAIWGVLDIPLLSRTPEFRQAAA
ncbi:MAG: chemotaxis protein CheW [Lysobacteraceae bacterium]|jgi:twitching motility protein PilI|nr:chemotaxis protein CheW [Xanthomonadaceae bacterium]MCZ8317805.1 chemotaxis protein CheW [Silanimonas sp.]